MDCDMPPPAKKSKVDDEPDRLLFYQSDGYLKEVLVRLKSYRVKRTSIAEVDAVKSKKIDSLETTLWQLKVYAPSDEKHLAFATTLVSQFGEECEVFLDERPSQEVAVMKLKEKLIKEIEHMGKAGTESFSKYIKEQVQLELETDLQRMLL